MRIHHALIPLAAVALLATAGVPALASDEPEPDQPMAVDIIEGLTWQLQQQAVDGVLTPVPEGIVATLRMEDGAAGGDGGCNTWFADYTRDGDALSFGPIGSTQMFCPGGESDVEAAYLANLASVASGASTGGSLVMADAAGDVVLEFLPADEEPMPVEAIEGITWLLSEYLVGGDAVASVPADVVATLLLDSGVASGSGGCNSFSAEYTLDGSSLTFGPVASTLRLCEGAAGEIETAYFAALAEVASWLSDGGSLTLADANSQDLLRFAQAPAATIEGSWVATGINNGRGGVVSSAVTGEVTAEFAADGSLSGSDSCNDYRTTYTVEGDSITIAPEIVTTRMSCASDELAEQSAWYLAALPAATTWSVTPQGSLELRDADGALQVSYLPGA